MTTDPVLTSFTHALGVVESTGQKCPSCGHRFRVLADESGQHACPRCGFHPSNEREQEPTVCTVCGGHIPNTRYDASNLFNPCVCPYCDGCGENVAEQPKHRCEWSG